MARIIDADTHVMEPCSVYVDHIDPRRRDDAIRVEPDDRGWPWLTWRGRRLHFLDEHVPGRVDSVGERRRRYHAGEPAPPLPPERADASDPAERAKTLAAAGTDAAILFPNLGLLWEDCLRDDVPALCANLEAQNTFQIERFAGHPRFRPVVQLTLRDLDRFEREVARAARAGVRLALVGPHPVGDRPLAHPVFDRAWAALQHHSMAMCFHVAQFQRPLDPAWYSLDPEPLNKVMDSVFLSAGPAAAVTNLIVHGKLEQFPGLRIGIMELTARWVPEFLMQIDGCWEFYRMQNGRPLTDLPLQPSDYFRRQVRVSAFAIEMPADLLGAVGDDVYMWCSDYPHAEGMSDPSWAEYQTFQPRPLTEPQKRALGGGNAAFLLGET